MPSYDVGPEPDTRGDNEVQPERLRGMVASWSRRMGMMASPTVMIVEGDALLADALALRLADQGNDVLLASCADAALAILEDQGGRVDVAVIDLLLPMSDWLPPLEAHRGRVFGLVLARLIRRMYPEVAIIGLSDGRQEETLEWLRENAFAYLIKPVRPQELTETVARAAREWKPGDRPTP